MSVINRADCAGHRWQCSRLILVALLQTRLVAQTLNCQISATRLLDSGWCNFAYIVTMVVIGPPPRLTIWLAQLPLLRGLQPGRRAVAGSGR